MELHELQRKLETMSLEDVGRTLFWLLSYMHAQKRETWEMFSLGIRISPYFPKEKKK